jgi:hypothetical protein
MRALILILTLGAVTALTTPVAAQSNRELRAQISAFVDERGLPEGVDRTCVIDRAVREHPNVPLTLAGPRLSGAAKAQHEANVRRIRIALAVNAGVEACAPAPTEGNEADGQP